jgi:two-component system chemotaxis response regulator CheY
VTEAPILVVDDDPSIVSTVSEILDFEGYCVQTAANGAEALRAIEHTQPSLVLLDMRMPVLDGWGFARALRERGVTLPIIVMTAAENAERWAHEIEAAGHVSKHFDLMDLIATVERFRTTKN